MTNSSTALKWFPKLFLFFFSFLFFSFLFCKFFFLSFFCNSFFLVLVVSLSLTSFKPWAACVGVGHPL